MNYKLKNVNGKVTFLLRTGKDLVKNQMAIASAQHIIDHGKYTKTVDPKYPIAIDNKWFFESEEITPSTPAEDNKVETSSAYGKFGKGAKKK